MAETKKGAPQKERTVTYRLGQPYSSRLEEEAERAGLSAGQYARLVLTKHFEETELHNLSAQVERLSRATELEQGAITLLAQEVNYLRRELVGFGSEVLLQRKAA